MTDAGVTAVALAIVAVVNLLSLWLKHKADIRAYKHAEEKLEAARIAAESAYAEANDANKKIANLQVAGIGVRRGAD